MTVEILFFGATAEAAGLRKTEMEMSEGIAAREALGRIVSTFPDLEKHSLLFAVNQEYSSGDEKIKAGDELAVFTAVSGG
jgi:molybdopterin converting factor small subunit